MEKKIEPLYSARWKLMAAVTGAILAGGFVIALDNRIHREITELKLGQLSEDADPMDRAVLCVDLNKSHSCIERAQNATWKKILWLGNSQLPTINQWQSGQKTMVSLLHETLAEHKHYVMGCAPPNSNLQEHLVIASYLLPKLEPKVVLLPVFYDDLRETGVREQMSDGFQGEDSRTGLQESDIGKLLLTEQEAVAHATTPTQSKSASTLDWSEAKLNEWLDHHSSYWSQRGTYRSVIFVDLFLLRNTIFGIKANSIRRMIPARYEKNMAAFDALLELAKKHNAKVLVYIPPIRNDVAIPYDMDAYSKFKKDLELQVVERGFEFADLDHAVPSDAWGTKESTGIVGGQEVDFMHFTYEGHKILASKLEQLILEKRLLEKE